jgi:hemerythrin
MGRLALQEDLITGADAIDHDHLRLVETINQACATLGDGGARDSVLDALGVLYVRTCAHFAMEEKMIRESIPERYVGYKLKYETLLERIRVIMDAFYDGECDVCEKSLKGCLRSWLEQHLQGGHPQLAIARA